MMWWLLVELAVVVVAQSCGYCVVGKVLGGVGLGHMEPVMVVVFGVCELWLGVANGWCVVVLELDVVGGAVVAGRFISSSFKILIFHICTAGFTRAGALLSRVG